VYVLSYDFICYLFTFFSCIVFPISYVNIFRVFCHLRESKTHVSLHLGKYIHMLMCAMETKLIKTIKLGDKGFLFSWTGRKRNMLHLPVQHKNENLYININNEAKNMDVCCKNMRSVIWDLGKNTKVKCIEIILYYPLFRTT
jgi:hypothetical protein